MSTVEKLISLGVSANKAKHLGFDVAESLSAAGDQSQANATEVEANIVEFTTVTSSDNSAKLPGIAQSAYCQYLVRNADSSDVLYLYPATGESINSESTNDPIKIYPKTSVLLSCIDSDRWISINEGQVQQFNSTTVTAAGSTQGDAASLYAGLNKVTGADGTKGVVLPTAEAGLVVGVMNNAGSNELILYPASGDILNNGGSNNPINIPYGYGSVWCVCYDDARWHIYRSDQAREIRDYSTVAATGSTQGDAASLDTKLVEVTAADGTKGVKLPSVEKGSRCIIRNASTSNLKLYPATSDAINGLSTNTALTLTNQQGANCFGINSTRWQIFTS